jgi:hypothetical protein
MISARRWRIRTNLRPSNLGAGIVVEHVAQDFRSITVALRPRRFPGPSAALHSGARLYAMVDSFLALMLQQSLGPDYLVWDKSGSIDVLAPARGRVWARLELNSADLERIRQLTESGDKHLHLFRADLCDAEGMAIARVEQLIYVRKTGTGP